MKKALQMVPLRAERSLPERAAVRRARETKGDGFCNDFPQALVADALRERFCLREVLCRGLRHALCCPRSRLQEGLGDGAGGEHEPGRSASPEPGADLLRASGQL